ncbi:MAG TPA: sulfurtransferase [Polyangiaceae bacterium]|nr:sulfurtransferase [Polyangiaceae bacterium]
MGWRCGPLRGEFPRVERLAVLISVDSLAASLAEPSLVIVDCRASLQNPAAGQKAHAQSHLPRAVFADLLEDLSGPIQPGKTGRHPLPPLDAFVGRLRAWGIGNSSQVVVYDDAGGAFAARLWWMLRWLGHDAVALLDGGFQAWVAAGKPVTAEVTLRPVGDFTPEPRSRLLVGADELLQSASRKLFDARTPERFRGDVEPIDPVAGHIPGAENLPFVENLRDGRFRPPAELRARFDAALSGTPPEDAVVYCGSGVTACHDVLAFAHAGLPLPRLYAGSWSEWITDATRPVAKD